MRVTHPFPRLQGATTPKRLEMVRPGLGHSKLHRTSKLHYWFKSYGDFTGGVDIAYWWSCIGQGLREACKTEVGIVQDPQLPFPHHHWTRCPKVAFIFIFTDFLTTTFSE